MKEASVDSTVPLAGRVPSRPIIRAKEEAMDPTGMANMMVKTSATSASALRARRATTMRAGAMSWRMRMKMRMKG